MKITDSGGNLFEQLTTVSGTPIVKKPLSYGRVRPLLKTPNTLTTATVTLDTVATIPAGGFIEAVLLQVTVLAQLQSSSAPWLAFRALL